MLARSARQSFKLCQNSVRMFNNDKADFDGSLLKKKGKGDEDIYFNRKEREQLKNLLHKLEDAGEQDGAIQSENAQEARHNLLAVLSKHSIRPSEGLIEDILSWKKKLY